jgi:hypothetical protein
VKKTKKRMQIRKEAKEISLYHPKILKKMINIYWKLMI